jgi:hypothetical protein
VVASNALKKSLKDLESRLAGLEGEFTDLRLTGSGQDTLRWPRRFYAKLISLTNWVEGSDFRPTDSQEEVFESFQDLFGDLETALQGIRDDVTSLNQALLDAGIKNILVGEQLNY